MSLLRTTLFALAALLAATTAHAQIAFRGAASAGVASGTAGAVTFIDSEEQSGGGGDVDVDIPGAAQAGDLLIAIIAVEDEDTGSITPPAGWTLIRGDDAGNHVQLTYYRFATAGDVGGGGATWTWDWGGNEDHSAAILAFRNVDPANPIDTHNGLATNSSNQTTIDIPAVTPTVSNTLLVAAASIRSGSSFGGWSGGLAERTDDASGGGGNEVAHGSATRAGPAAGASSGAFTVTASNNDTSRVGQLIALRPALLGLTINVPAGTVSGDVMIASIVVRPSSVIITPPAGWAAQAAALQNAAGNSSRQQIFYRVAGGAEPASYTWLFDTAHTGAAGGILSFSGVDIAAPFDAFGGNLTPQGGDSNLQHRALAVTTTVADAMLISTHSFTSADTWTPPTGMTERVDVASQATPNAVGIALEMNTVLQPAAGTTGDKVGTAAGNGDTGSATLMALRPFVPQPVLHWRMDELAWSGAANEVVDSSGNGLHGRSVNGASTAFLTPAIAGSPGTCRYGVLDGTNDVIETADHALLDITDELTVMMWLRPTAYPGAGLKSFMSKDANYEAHLTTTGTINWWWGGGALQLNSAGSVPLNTWTHVALVYSRAGAFQRIYLNGVQDPNTNNQAGALTTNNNPFQIGGDQGFAGREFPGLVDEVYVFRSALSQARVQQYMNTARPCVSAIDHFAFGHAGSGVGCVDQPITLTAHDLTHNPVDANALVVSLSTSNLQGTWTGIQAGGGVLNDPAPGDGAATYTFAVGSNSATLLFRYADLGTPTEVFNFNVSGGGFTEATGTGNASDDPPFTMAQAGFRFRNIEDANETIVTQISGKPSNTGWNARTVRLQAINTDTSSGACTNLFANQAQTVELGGECNNPAACAAQQVSVNAASIATSNDNGGTGAAAYTGVLFNFNASSEADAVLVYPDAGAVSLHARFDLNPLVAGFEMLGASNNYVVRPFGLAFPGVNHSSTAAGSLIAAAGDNFAMTVQGYRWAAGEDTNDDGVPDAGANITDNGTVPNFAAAAVVGVSGNLPGVAPGAVSRGAGCANPANVAVAGGAGAAADWCYSEVGNALFSASVTNYLAPGINISGNSGLDGDAAGGYVGRFKPKHFVVTGASTLTNRAALACASSFTYMNEGLRLGFTLEARNAQNALTQNYTGAYAKLDLASMASLGIGARSGATNLTPRVDNALVPVGGFANGAASLTAVTGIRRAAPDSPDGPFPGTQFGIAPNDNDPNAATGVQMQSFDLDVDGAGGNDHFAIAPVTELRFGQLSLDNAYGPVSLPVPIPLETQYWNGGGFVTNTLDSCTTLARANIALAFTGSVNPCETALTQPTYAFSSGATTLVLAAPGPGNQGTVLLTPQLGTAAGSYCPAVGAGTLATVASPAVYLIGRWNDAANPDANPATSYDDKPPGQAGFGLYGSQPRNFIFFRENY